MWARIVEAVLGCWLLISPLIFYRAEAPARLWWIDLSLGGLTILLALGSYWPPSRRAHLGLLLVAGVLAGLALVSSDPPPPESQNHMLVGLLLLLFAIIPSEASAPPRRWRTFYEQRSRHARGADYSG